MERGEMVPGKTAIYESTTANPENMDREDTGNDNAHANKGQKNDTPETMRRNDYTKTKIQEQWKKRHMETQNKQRKEEKETPHELDWGKKVEYAKQQKQTYITQLVEKRPEIPEELELNKERRKQLAELMLEYPTQTDEMEKESLTQENAGEKRYYACQNCGKPYSAIRGKLNHLENNPK